jgi:nicotinamidase-related amidase
MIANKGILTEREEYSIFDNHDANLHEILQSYDVTEVHVCGVATEYCVLETAKSAACLGYETYVLRDLCKSVGPDSDKVFNGMGKIGIVVC